MTICLFSIAPIHSFISAAKQHIFITFFFREVKTSPKYDITVMLWFSELKTTPKYDVNATL